jgi:signal transduction histidine kinase/HAMP domain-containing protein
MHKSIRIRLLSAFLLIIAVLTISEGFFIAINFRIIRQYEKLEETLVSEYQIIDDTSKMIESFKLFIGYPNDSEKMTQLIKDKNSLIALLAALDTEIIDPDSRAVYLGLKNTINNIIAEIHLGMSNATGESYVGIMSHYENARRLNAFVKDNSSELILLQLAYAKSLEVRLDRVQSMSELLTILMFILVTLGCVVYALRFSKKLIKPLTILTKVAKDIEGGNLKAIVNKETLSGDDEVSSLANSFNTMVFSLRQSIEKLQEYNLEIKNSQNKLSAEKNKLQQYLDVAGVIVLIFSPKDNSVLLINKRGREILEVETTDIISKNWVKLFVSKYDHIKTEGVINLFAGGVTPTNDTLENILITKTGKEKNIVWHFTTLKNEKGEAESILATGVDITELTSAKITINQLKELDKLKSEVMNIATHELKTPLISIVGLSEVMMKKPESLIPEFQNYLSIIHKEALKLTNLIKTMLTSSRNEIGRASVVKEKFNLSELLLSLTTSLKILADRSKSQVAFEIEDNNLEIESDKDKISQVIYNLVDNAVKYGPEGQTIKINLIKPDNKFVKISVTGAGVGISKENQKKIFLKFSQLEPSLSRSQDGMGLGLYICKQNIENLGGKIGVISAPGEGATFYFTLPIIAKKI